MPKERPTSCARLNNRILKLANGNPNESEGITLVMSYVAAIQMMPEAAVKGGAGLKLRFGDAETRYSTDLDSARKGGVSSFIEEYRACLRRGWQGFSGALRPLNPAKPKDVPPEYVMRPFEVQLSYEGSVWRTVDLELGHNELGDADDPDWAISEEVLGYFTSLGFERPNPIPLMKLEYQIAQKLHAVSEPGSKRAHDLVDLQIIMGRADVDYGLLNELCVRLFRYRNKHSWPPTVRCEDAWDDLYTEAANGLDVLADVHDAVDWVNKLIGSICDCTR